MFVCVFFYYYESLVTRVLHGEKKTYGKCLCKQLDSQASKCQHRPSMLVLQVSTYTLFDHTGSYLCASLQPRLHQSMANSGGPRTFRPSRSSCRSNVIWAIMYHQFPLDWIELLRTKFILCFYRHSFSKENSCRTTINQLLKH